jgi:hypothetical protein
MNEGTPTIRMLLYSMQTRVKSRYLKDAPRQQQARVMDLSWNPLVCLNMKLLHHALQV